MVLRRWSIGVGKGNLTGLHSLFCAIFDNTVRWVLLIEDGGILSQIVFCAAQGFAMELEAVAILLICESGYGMIETKGEFIKA